MQHVVAAYERALGGPLGRLPLTAHLGEERGSDAETALVFARLPVRRIGHGVCLSEEHFDQFAVGRCVEMCPTSNMCTLGLADMHGHPMVRRARERIERLKQGRDRAGTAAFVICTDDIGLFLTSPRREAQLCEALGWAPEDAVLLAHDAMEFAFCSAGRKAEVRAQLGEYLARRGVALDLRAP